jgi:hypothetical protein
LGPTDEFALGPPSFVAITAADEQVAITALAELLAAVALGGGGRRRAPGSTTGAGRRGLDGGQTPRSPRSSEH